MHETARVFIEALIGLFLGMFLAYLIDLIFHRTYKNRVRWKSTLLTFTQLLVDVVVVWLVLLLARRLHLFTPGTIEGTVGFTIFSIIFFLGQRTLAIHVAVAYGYENEITKASASSA